MRRYELMLVLSPDVPDDKSQAVIDKSTRLIVAAGGQIIKVAPGADAGWRIPSVTTAKARTRSCCSSHRPRS